MLPKRSKINYPIQWYGIHETMFSTVDFLAHQILGNVESQIEIEKVFFLASIFTSLKGCHL